MLLCTNPRCALSTELQIALLVLLYYFNTNKRLI